MLLKISVRSLLMRWRQYISLLFVCALGSGVSLFALFLINGMLRSLSTKAKIYYGGDYQFVGGLNDLSFGDYRNFVTKIESVFGGKAVVSPRFDFDAASSAIYFEGVGVRQRIIKGVDFDREKKLFEKFNYVDGSAEKMAGTNGVLLSDKIAQMLECSVGDQVTLMLRTAQGYTNTVQLVVKGIFLDSSVFGFYTSYMDLNFLQKAYCIPEFYANRIGIFFDGDSPSSADDAKFQKLLEAKFDMFRMVKDKYIFYDQLLSGRLGEKYALIPLYANMKELQVVIDAIKVIALFVIVTLIAIIVIGISSTYRVIVMKRINEIGIFKAIGMERRSVLLLLLSEASALLVAGCIFGLLLSFGFCRVIEKFNFLSIPAFNIFLTDGILLPAPTIFHVALIFCVVTVTTIFAVLFSVQTAIKITPVQALAVTE